MEKKQLDPERRWMSKAWAFHRLPTVISFGGGGFFLFVSERKGGTNWMLKSPSFLLSDESTHHTQLNRTKRTWICRLPLAAKLHQDLECFRPVLLMDTFLLMNIAVLKTRGPMFSRKKTSFGLGTLLHCLLKCTGWIYFLTQDSRGKWRYTSEFPTSKYQKYNVILMVTVIWVIHPMYWNWKVHILLKWWGHQGCCCALSPMGCVTDLFFDTEKRRAPWKFQKQSILFCQLGDITAFTVRIFRRPSSINSDCNRASKILHLLATMITQVYKIYTCVTCTPLLE